MYRLLQLRKYKKIGFNIPRSYTATPTNNFFGNFSFPKKQTLSGHVSLMFVYYPEFPGMLSPAKNMLCKNTRKCIIFN